MFDLVNDIESYPKFLHWCSGARVDVREADAVEASLDVGLAGLHRTFKTRNTVLRPKSIAIALVSGPFKKLEGQWRFDDESDGGSTVSLDLLFEVALSPFGVIFARIFEEIASSQMDAFIRRARELYGRRE